MVKKINQANNISTAKTDTKPSQSSGRKERILIPTAVKYRVYLRDEGQCTYVDRQGKRCKEQRMLEFDHVRMFCRGGDNSKDNLRLRCRYHNQKAAEQKLGYRWAAD